jgi:putative transcriptional regulator
VVIYLHKLRTIRKLSEAELAEKVGVTRNYINMISHGHRLPSLTIALNIAQILGVDVGDIWSTQKPNSRT